MVPCVTAAWISVNSGPDGSRVLLYSFLIILSTCQKVTSWKQVLFSVYNSLMRPTLASTAYHGSLQLPTGAIRCHLWRPRNGTWSSRAWSHRKSWSTLPTMTLFGRSKSTTSGTRWHASHQGRIWMTLKNNEDIRSCLDILHFLSAELPWWNQRIISRAKQQQPSTTWGLILTDKVEVKQDWWPYTIVQRSGDIFTVGLGWLTTSHLRNPPMMPWWCPIFWHS